jgi:hypothetical protein
LYTSFSLKALYQSTCELSEGNCVKIFYSMERGCLFPSALKCKSWIDPKLEVIGNFWNAYPGDEITFCHVLVDITVTAVKLRLISAVGANSVAAAFFLPVLVVFVFSVCLFT